MRYVPLLLLLASCATTPTQEEPDNSRIEDLERRVTNLEDLNSGNVFMIELDRCFIDLLMCERGKKTQCWERHEQCAINVHRMYKARSKTN